MIRPPRQPRLAFKLRWFSSVVPSNKPLSSTLEQTALPSTIAAEDSAVATAKKLGWRGIGAVTAFYTLLTMVLTWPLILNFSNATVPGYEGDLWQNFWNFWWVKHRLFNLQNPFQTDFLYYPYYNGPGPFSTGQLIPLYFHNLQLINGIFVLPFTLFDNYMGAYNAIVFGSFIASGVGACLLAYHWVRNLPAALLAGLVFAFSFVRYDALSYSWTNIFCTQWLPFYILALHCWHETHKRRYMWGAIACLVGAAYTDWYNTTYLVFYTAFFFLITGWPRHWWRQFKLVLPLAVGSFVLAAPLLVPSVFELNKPLYIAVYAGLDKDYRGSTFLSEIVNPLRPQGMVIYLSLLLAGVVLLLRRKQAFNRPIVYWLAFGLICTVLSLGPKLQWERVRGVEPDGPYLPYILFKYLPAFQIMRAAERFEIPSSLGFGVMLAFAVTALSKMNWALVGRLAKRIAAPTLIASSLAVLVGGLVIATVNRAPFPMETPSKYAFVDTLLQDKSNYYLMELPITRHNNFDYTRMYSQIRHQRPIMGGYLSRPIYDPYRAPDSPFRYLTEMVYASDPKQEIFPAEYSQAMLDNLIKLNHFDYVVVYKEDYSKQSEIEQVRAMLDSRLGKASLIQEDARTLTYKTPPDFWQRPAIPGVLLGEGWYGVEKNNDGLYRWTRQQADFTITVEKAGQVKVSLTALAFGGDRPMRITANGQTVFEGRITPAPEPLSFEFAAKAGTTALRIESLTPAQNGVETGLSKDTRPLAFLIRNLSVQ